MKKVLIEGGLGGHRVKYFDFLSRFADKAFFVDDWVFKLPKSLHLNPVVRGLTPIFNVRIWGAHWIFPTADEFAPFSFLYRIFCSRLSLVLHREESWILREGRLQNTVRGAFLRGRILCQRNDIWVKDTLH